jgi:LAO/AO transport system kinase
MELADVVVVNKSDGALEAVAGTTAADYASALRLMRPRSPAWKPEVLRASSLNGRGVPEIWVTLLRYRDALAAAGELVHRRGEQNRSWLWDEVRDRVIGALHHDPHAAELELAVVDGRRSPTSAADELIVRWKTAL